MLAGPIATLPVRLRSIAVLAVRGLMLPAFAAFGCVTPTVVTADALPDACAVLSNDDVRPLLFGRSGGTLDSYGDRPSHDAVTCRWEARVTGSSAVRVLRLEVVRLANAAAATADLRGRIDFDRDTSAALRDTRDAVIRSGPDDAYARHGSVIAHAAVGGISRDGDASARRYWLEASALRAAGARVKPMDDPFAWGPPRYEPGPIGGALEPLVAALGFVVTHRFLMLPVFIGLGVVLAGVGTRARLPGPSTALLLALPIATGVLAIVLGPWISDAALYRAGTSAAATITGTFDTSVRYNSHDVVGYDVLMKGVGGAAVRTTFQDDDFNVYPSHNATVYPGVGDVFTVRYLPRFPHRFVIVSNDDSPWARAVRCERLSEPEAEARRRLAFAPGDSDAAAALARASAARRADRCPAPGEEGLP